MSKRKSIEELASRIKIASFKFGLRGEDIQDATQEILLRMYEGKHKHSTVDQMLIDYLRTQSGRKGEVGYDSRKALARPERLYASNGRDRGLVDGAKFRDLEYGVDTGLSDRLVDGRIDCERYFEKLKLFLNERELFIYNSYTDEKTLKEIGEDLGLTESRASQLLKKIKDKLFAVFFIENLNIKNNIKDDLYQIWEK